MSYEPVSPREEEIATAIVDAAFQVHSRLGPGLIEPVYEPCFCYELKKHGFTVERQVTVPIIYDGVKLEEALRLDVIVEKLVICELKAVQEVIPLFEAQLLSYMKLLNKRLGFLINFHVPIIKQGIKRMIL
ncbi:GxxExxY protein [candidate division KSB1 bacterium]|nr:GxxExxY protein [candidate division KSB1 bacterium]